MATIQTHIQVLGHVQGVGYRYHCQQAALQHHILGWVTNKSDGSVEIMAQGESDNMSQFIKWTKQGPSYAHVDKIITDDIEPLSPFDHFSIL